MGNRIDRRFDYLRKQTEQDAKRAGEEAAGNIERQAASQGMQGSGAFIKLGQQADESIQKQKAQNIEGVEAARDVALGQKEEADLSRQFAREERLGSQDFSSKENQMGRSFQSEEAGKNRAFQSSEAAAARGFEREIFDKNDQWRREVFDVQNDQWEETFKNAKDQWKKDYNLRDAQFDKTFDAEEKINAFNMDMANKMWNKKDMTESIMNAGGYDPRSGGYGGGNTPWANSGLSQGLSGSSNRQNPYSF